MGNPTMVDESHDRTTEIKEKVNIGKFRAYH
jgi:hypothetical protein